MLPEMSVIESAQAGAANSKAIAKYLSFIGDFLFWAESLDMCSVVPKRSTVKVQTL